MVFPIHSLVVEQLQFVHVTQYLIDQFLRYFPAQLYVCGDSAGERPLLPLPLPLCLFCKRLDCNNESDERQSEERYWYEKYRMLLVRRYDRVRQDILHEPSSIASNTR